jgi:hypothetical protein
VSRGDRRLVDDVATEVAALLDRTGADLVFAPVGIGRHVDHLVTRAVGERFPDRVVYYADFPYNVAGSPDPDFLARHGLTPWHFERGLAGKQPLIRGYRTQAEALFRDGRIPVVPETFYVTAS